MAENYDERPLRFCDSCGKVDRAPRHVFATPPDQGVSNGDLVEKALENASAEETLAIFKAVADTAGIYKHIDCCAADGCPGGTCQAQLDEAGGKKDEELAKFLSAKVEV